MANTKFIRQIEDFICSHCDQKVSGNGYTNHCPNCLWSLHIDNHPGDRASKCQGLMKPISLIKKGDNYQIIHECQKCGHTKSNKMSPDDNFDLALKLTS